MISKINLRSNVMVSGGPKFWATGNQEIIADWELIKFHCKHCGLEYNAQVHINEFRPVIDGLDDYLPTLYILPGGNTSPRGAFGFRELGTLPTEVHHKIHKHYYRKDQADLLFLVGVGSTVEFLQTRRYINKDLWPKVQLCPTTGRWTGTLGYEENDFSLVYWAKNCEFLTLPEYRMVETTHMKCVDEFVKCNLNRIPEEAQVGCTETLSRVVYTFRIGCTEIHIVRPENKLTGEVQVGTWACSIMPGDFPWEGSETNFSNNGAMAPISKEIIENRFDELYNLFSNHGIIFYLEDAGWFLPDGTDVTEISPPPEEAEWRSTGRVAFQWRDTKNEG